MLDLEGVEFFIRSAMLAQGAAVLEHLLEGLGVGHQQTPLICMRNHLPRRMISTGVREKTILTILGPVRFARSRYLCPSCKRVEYPGDALLGVQGSGFSPGMRRLMTHAGSRESFREAAQDLRLYGSIHVHAKDIERVAEMVGRQIEDWMAGEASAAVMAARQGSATTKAPLPILYIELDGTGAPMRKAELAGVRGKEGEAKTNEVKLGCVFTQTALDDEGRPVRDEASTSYVGAIEPSLDFGHRLYGEAVRRGLEQAQRVVVISDGASYNRKIIQEHFPDATHIIDLYHARGHLADFIRIVAPTDAARFHARCLKLLDAGRIKTLASRLQERLPSRGKRRIDGLKEINYFVKRAEAMRYDTFRKQGLFVGSGVIEAGCKTIIGKRFKNSGMFWSKRGLNAITAARCCLYSGRFEDFWAAAAP